MKSALILISAIWLFGCIRQPEPEPCVQQGSSGQFIVRAMDKSGADISSASVVDMVEVTTFSHDMNFISSANAKLTVPISISHHWLTKMAVVGWGNMNHSGHVATALKQGDNIANGRVDLNTLPDGSNGTPSDLFFGSQTVNLTQNAAVQVLWLRRAVAAVAVKAINVRRVSDKARNITFVVKGSSTSLNFYGEPLNNDAVFIPAVNFNGDDVFETVPFRTFSNIEGSGLTIDIYEDGALLKTVSRARDNMLLTVRNDNILYVVIDFDDESGVSFTFAEWNSIAILQQF